MRDGPAPGASAPTQTDMDLDLAPSPPRVEDLIAARRAKRQAILAKYSNGTSSTSTPVASQSSQAPLPALLIAEQSITRANSVAMSVDGTPAPEKYSQGERRASMSNSPPPLSAQDTAGDIGADLDKLDAADNLAFELAKGDEQDGMQAPDQETISKLEGGHDQISAADYDPSRDRREDEHKRLLGEVPHKPKVEDVMEIEEIEDVEEEDVDDMFAVAMGEPSKKTKKVKKTVSKPAPVLITTTALLDTAADAEGYYSVILGEQIDGGRYQVVSSLGKGMFANVVRGLVLQSPPEAEGILGAEVGKEVAIKIVRSQESMYRAGLKEAQILQKIRQADPDDKKHLVRLERTFEHRGHLCLVFESMSMNLRDVVKRFGKDVGLNISAVRTYAHQLFLALSLLKKLNIMHADIKPDNILVNERKNLLKLCDLGSASDASENDITPYLVSRFYRAPEIILGVPYDPALDIWSVGCTLYELYTGKILFPGRSNNQMLLLMMELKGRFNTKMIKKAKFQDAYFDEMGGFESVERDKVTGADVIRKIHLAKPTRDLRARLMPPTSVKMNDNEAKLLTSFIDLLDKCLALDPSRRITPREALSHPFIRG
ncbi:kinase-like protein [Pluteus cervinus]|uniref:Kinase-like protein n=1 Tax=Pluteus cervinus TaxID=181527 RepID=A0ACD3ATI5_9AGAR|nr:kinase-like protein [Pluteus cervinus]